MRSVYPTSIRHIHLLQERNMCGCQEAHLAIDGLSYFYLLLQGGIGGILCLLA